MGGKALKHARTSRLELGPYLRVQDEVIALLQDTLTGVQIAAIPAYREKATFGDLDLLISDKGLERIGGWEGLAEWAVVNCAASDTSHTKNGCVLSFDYRNGCSSADPGFQVDLIVAPDATFDFATQVYSYNEAGILIGRIFNGNGYKLRHDGLWADYMVGVQKHRRIRVTDNFDKALSLIGLDAHRFRQGFDTLNEISSFVSCSPNFAFNQFDLSLRKREDRIRLMQRPGFMAFLEWCAESGLKERTSNVQPLEREKLFAAFPQFRRDWERADDDYAMFQKSRLRLNGHVVNGLTGSKGPSLGALIDKLKEGFPSDEVFHTFVVNQSDETLHNYVIRTHRKLAQEESGVCP